MTSVSYCVVLGERGVGGNMFNMGFSSATPMVSSWLGNCSFFFGKMIESGYTYMAVWVGGLEVWEIRDVCNID